MKLVAGFNSLPGSPLLGRNGMKNACSILLIALIVVIIAGVIIQKSVAEGSGEKASGPSRSYDIFTESVKQRDIIIKLLRELIDVNKQILLRK